MATRPNQNQIAAGTPSEGDVIKSVSGVPTWGAGGGGGGFIVLPVLAGPAVTHDATGWKVVGTITINPSNFTFTQAVVEYLASTTVATDEVRLRLWNSMTSAQVGTTQVSTSLSTVRLTENITLTAGMNIYEVQISSEVAATYVLCAGASILLT